MNDAGKSKRGPHPVDASEKRVHCVSVRLSGAELATVESRRGYMQKGEFLRCAALDTLPPTIPELNRETYGELAHAQANLNQIAYRINCDDATLEIENVKKILKQFRQVLLGDLEQKRGGR